jgi:inner membrane protein
MDPLTHATLGAAVALATADRRVPPPATALVGLASGMLPDADIFLSSATDPLFNLEYHRHFSHSLLLSPAIALLGILLASLALRLFHQRPSLRPLLLPAWLATLSHLFCDLWTSYGTRLFWPFADKRAALDWISVIDPVFTLPLLALTLLALKRQTSSVPRARLALAWAALYLALCSIQHHRALSSLHSWLASQQRPPATRFAAHPSFGNILVWRVLVDHQGSVQVLAIRCGLGTPHVFPGPDSALWSHPEQAIAHFNLDPASPQARDVRRFFHFSMNWVGPVSGHPLTLGDLRYATLPDSIAPLWGIELQPPGNTPPVRWRTFRQFDSTTRLRLLSFLTGNPSPPPTLPAAF